MRRSCNPIVLVTLGFLPLLAPLAGRAEDGIAACAAISEDTQRLDCYDRLAGRSTSVAPQAAPAAPAVTTDPIADFGLPPKVVKARDPQKWNESTPGSISGTVASVRHDHLGRFSVTLTDGQVWVQNDTKSNAIVRPGDAITIKRAALGSFMLTTPRKVSTRVRRLQ